MAATCLTTKDTGHDSPNISGCSLRLPDEESTASHCTESTVSGSSEPTKMVNPHLTLFSQLKEVVKSPADILIRVDAATHWISAQQADLYLQLQADVIGQSDPKQLAKEAELNKALTLEQQILYKAAMNRRIDIVAIQSGLDQGKPIKQSHSQDEEASSRGCERVGPECDYSIPRKSVTASHAASEQPKVRHSQETAKCDPSPSETPPMVPGERVLRPPKSLGSVRRARLVAESALADANGTSPWPSPTGTGNLKSPVTSGNIPRTPSSHLQDLIDVLQHDQTEERKRSGSVTKARLAATKALEEAVYLSRLQRLDEETEDPEHIEDPESVDDPKRPGSVRNALAALPQRVEQEEMKRKASTPLRPAVGPRHPDRAHLASGSSSAIEIASVMTKRGSVGNALDNLEQRRANEPLSPGTVASRRPQWPPRLASLPTTTEAKLWLRGGWLSPGQNDAPGTTEQARQQSRPEISHPMLPRPNVHLRGGASTFRVPRSNSTDDLTALPRMVPAPDIGVPRNSPAVRSQSGRRTSALVKRVSTQCLKKCRRMWSVLDDEPLKEEQEEPQSKVKLTNGEYIGHWGEVLGKRKVNRMSVAKIDHND